jgi:putative tricarboxylic transport membrane protein
MIHGLRPGADLFTLNADITYGFILSLLVANILFVPIGLLFARYCARVIRIPVAILAPCILALAVIGSYSIRGATEDVLIMLFMGMVGFAMTLFSVPRAPLVLGLVLGTLAESELARSLALVQGDVPAFLTQLVTRPICLVLLCLCAYALYQGIVQHRRNSKLLDN